MMQVHCLKSILVVLSIVAAVGLVNGAAAQGESSGSSDVLEIYFHEDFSSATPFDRGWTTAGNVTVAHSTSEIGDTESQVVLSTVGAKLPAWAELCSPAIDLMGLPGADLTFTIGHGGVEIGKHLVVEFLTADGRWESLTRIQSGGLDDAGEERVTRTLPLEALQSFFRVRFRIDGGDADDVWRVGEMTIREYEPLRRLTVRLDPPRQAWTKVVLSGRLDGMDAATPFTKRFPSGASVYLVAPPAVDENVFSYWTVSNGYETRERVLLLEMSEHLEATAHYAPWTLERSEASVLIFSRPVPGVPLKLGAEPGDYFTEMPAEIEYAGLAGEWLLLLAPERTERLAFRGWAVNGEPLATSDCQLRRQIADRDVLTAEYVLLGDVNGDDSLDKHDVELFIAALIDPQGYAQAYPHLDREQRGDVNGDGVFDALDLEAFVDLLTGE